MNLKIEVRNEGPFLTAAHRSKYADIVKQIVDLEPGKWLVVSGFVDIAELNKTQAGTRSYRNLKFLNGTKYITKRNVAGDNLELWFQKIP